MKVKFSDVVKRINIFVDINNTDRKYYIGKGGSIESDAFEAYPKALIEGATIGYKFHFGFNPGHILFMSRSFEQHKAATATFYGVCSDSTYVVETRDEKVLLQRYLQVEMQSDRFWNWLMDHKTGGVNYLINYSTLAEYEFDLPSIEHQKEIADILWSAYDLKVSYGRMIDSIDEMVKSQFIEQFSSCTSSIKLGEAASYINGFAFKPSDWGNTGLPIIRIQNLTGSTSCYNYYSGSYPLQVEINDGDILISWSATLGVYIWNKGKALLNQHIFKVVFDKKSIDRDYFIFAVRCNLDEMVERTHGTAMKHIIKGDFNNILIPYPSMTAQKEFGVVIRQTDKSKFELKQAIEKIDKVMRALMQ